MATLQSLRAKLAQRMRYWGGSIDGSTTGAFTDTGDLQTAVDTTNRSEPDGEWDNSYIALYGSGPGGAAIPTWNRIADGGYTQSNGTFLLTNQLQDISLTADGKLYELFKVFSPDQWVAALNWAIMNSYPQRHRKVVFEVQEDPGTRVYDYYDMAVKQSLANPTVPLTATPINNPIGQFAAGTYYFWYTWYNEVGETGPSPVAGPITLTANQSVDIAQINNVPASALGVRYYATLQPGLSSAVTNAGLLDTDLMQLPTTAPVNAVKARQFNGTIPEIYILNPVPQAGILMPSVNTTNIDIVHIHSIQRRVNPGAAPQRWVDLGSDKWIPIGGTSIQLQYMPVGQYNLRFILSTYPATLAVDTDATPEPLELLLAGAEYYLWDLLFKSGTVVGVNWEKLSQDAFAKYIQLKMLYALDPPRHVIHVPTISVSYK